MGYKIQITVDGRLNEAIKARAKQLGLSVSSYARLALMGTVPHTSDSDQPEDIKLNYVEALTLGEFCHQLDAVEGDQEGTS